jgi:hypothetical protein
LYTHQIEDAGSIPAPATKINNMKDIVTFHLDDGSTLTVDFLDIESIKAVPAQHWPEIKRILNNLISQLQKLNKGIYKDRSFERVDPKD